LEDEPDQPLCPWQDDFSCHDRYYSTVGGHDEAFEQFKQKLQPGQLDRASRIVVITGPPLSGKTSLANRCVYWVREGLSKETTRSYIYPLRGVSPSRATVEDRVKKVCRRLIEKLRELNPGSGEGLAGNLLSADEVLPLFGRFHQPSGRRLTQYFIILLPRLEPDTAEIEIDEYRAALDGVRGVLCVTENLADVPLPAYRGEAPPISLHLRHLHTGECRTVVGGWPGAPREGDSLPFIREEDLDELEDLLRTMNGKITLGKLLTALRKVYNNSAALGDHPGSDVRYVEYSELVKAYLGKWGRLTPAGGSHEG
jgi:hypothetical protein